MVPNCPEPSPHTRRPLCTHLANQLVHMAMDRTKPVPPNTWTLDVGCWYQWPPMDHRCHHGTSPVHARHPHRFASNLVARSGDYKFGHRMICPLHWRAPSTSSCWHWQSLFSPIRTPQGHLQRAIYCADCCPVANRWASQSHYKSLVVPGELKRCHWTDSWNLVRIQNVVLFFEYGSSALVEHSRPNYSRDSWMCPIRPYECDLAATLLECPFRWRSGMRSTRNAGWSGHNRNGLHFRYSLEEPKEGQI